MCADCACKWLYFRYGFNTAKLLGKYGSLYKVAASSHATKQDAISATKNATSINKDAYVEKVNL